MNKIPFLLLFYCFVQNPLYCQNIGIGTATPTATLHVKGQDPLLWGSTILPMRIDMPNGTQVAALNDQGQVFLSNNTTDYAMLNINKTATASIPHILLEHSEPGELVSVAFNHTGNGAAWWEVANKPIFDKSIMRFTFDQTNYPLYLESGGQVGINTKTPQQKLDVIGDVNITGGLVTASIATNGNVVVSGGAGQGTGTVTAYSTVAGFNFFNRAIGGTSAPPNMPRYVPLTTGFTIDRPSKLVIDYKLTLHGTNNGCGILSCGDSEAIIHLILQNQNTLLINNLSRRMVVVRNQRPDTFGYKCTVELDPTIIGGGIGSYSLYVYVEHFSGPWIEGRGIFPTDPTQNYMRVQLLPN
jgi:hypothetical protein